MTARVGGLSMKRNTEGVSRFAGFVWAAAVIAALTTPAALRARHQPMADLEQRGGDDQGRGGNDQGDDQNGDDHSRDTGTPIEHVVIIFQENVSFDHYFATYPNAHPIDSSDGPAFTPRADTPLVNGLFAGGLLDHNPNTFNGQPAQPFRLSHAQAVTCDQDHNYKDEELSFNAGAMNRFPDTVGVGTPCAQPDYGHGKALVMGYYDGNTVTA